VSEEKNDSGVRAARQPEVVASIPQISRYMFNHIFQEYSGNLAIPIPSCPLNQTAGNHFFSGYPQPNVDIP
jgi:hypothetical protein